MEGMTTEERQFLRTAVWLFMRHGRSDRALGVCEALHEADPRDGVAAVALAELLLERADAKRAVDVLREADVLSLHCPLTPETRDLVCAERIAKMKDGAYIVNAARGGLVRDADLARALVSGEADVPPELAHAEAVLETRALRLAGRTGEADFRWRRYIESRKGADRKWV